MEHTKKLFIQFVLVLAFGLFMLFVLSGAGVEGAKITVDDDGGADHESIQDAIDAASEGDLIRVRDGNYAETINIDKPLTIKGYDATNTTIDGGNTSDVVTVSANYVNLSGFTIKNSDATGSGVYSEKDHGMFEYLNLTANYDGIYLKNSVRNTLKESEVYANTKTGVRLELSNFNTIMKNTLKKNEDGVALSFASYNSISLNTAMDNTDDGIDIDPISQYNKVENNIASMNDFGIICTGATWNTIANNTAQYNTYFGLSLYLESHNNTLINNTASMNGVLGIAVHAANDSLITQNTVKQNGFDGTIGGMYINLSHNNYVTHNEITHNDGYGIVMENATEHTVRYNTIAENDDGLYTLGEIFHNRIYFNDIYNNTKPETGMANLNTRAELYASYNWWGDATGPEHFNNANGKGDKINGLVEFDPWFTALLDGFTLYRIEDTLAPHEVKYYVFNVTTDGKIPADDIFTIWSEQLEDRKNLSAVFYYGVEDYQSMDFGMLPPEDWRSDPFSYFNEYTPIIYKDLGESYVGNVQGLIVVENLGHDTFPFELEHNLKDLKEKAYTTTLMFEPYETKYFNLKINGTNTTSVFAALAGWSNETELEDVWLEFKYLETDWWGDLSYYEEEFGWVWGEYEKTYLEIFNYTANGTLVVTNARSYPLLITLRTMVEFKEVNNTLSSTIAPGKYQYYSFSLENMSQDDDHVINVATWLDDWTHEENFTVALYGMDGWWDDGYFEYTGYSLWYTLGWDWDTFYIWYQNWVDYNSTFYLVVRNTGNVTIDYSFNSLYQLTEINNTECITLKSNETYFFTFDVYGMENYPELIHTVLMMKEGNETHLEAMIYHPSEWGPEYDDLMGGWIWNYFEETMEADVYKSDKALLALTNTGYGEIRFCVNSLHELVASNNRYNITLNAREVRYYNLTIENLSCIAAWQEYADMWDIFLEFKYIAREDMYSYWEEDWFSWWEWQGEWYFDPYVFMNVMDKNATKGYLVVRNMNDTEVNLTINSVHMLYLQDHHLVDNISAGTVNYYKMIVPYVAGEPGPLFASMWLNNLTNQTNLTARAFYVGWFYDESWEYYLNWEDDYIFGWHFDFSEGYIYETMLQDYMYISTEEEGEEEFFMDYYAVYFVVESWWNETVNFTLNAPYKIVEIENNTFSAVFAPGETKYYTFSAREGEENATFVSIAKWLEYGDDMNMSYKLKHWEAGDEEYTTEWFMTGRRASQWAIANDSRFLLIVTNMDDNESKLWFNSVYNLTEINNTYELMLDPGETVFYEFTLDATMNESEVFSIARWMEEGNISNVSVEIKYWEDGWMDYSSEYMSFCSSYECELHDLFYAETNFLLVVTNENDMTVNLTFNSLFELTEVDNTLSETLDPYETKFYEFDVELDEDMSELVAFAGWLDEGYGNLTIELKYWEEYWDWYNTTWRYEEGWKAENPYQRMIVTNTSYLVVVTNNEGEPINFTFNSFY